MNKSGFYLFFKKTKFLFAFLPLIIFCTADVGANALLGNTISSPAVTLVGRAVEDSELIELTITVTSEGGLCGMLAQLSYDSDILCFSSGAVENDCYTLSLYDAENYVRFLIEGDFEENFETIIVRFYFTCVSEESGTAIFTVSLPDSENGAFLLRNNTLECVPVDLSSAVTVIQYGHTEKNGGETEVILRKAQMRISDDGSKYVRIIGDVRGEGIFAAGFKVFVTEVGSGKAYGYCLAGVLGKESSKSSRPNAFEQTVPLKEGESYCLIITPIAYSRESVFCGEKATLFISKNETASKSSHGEEKATLSPRPEQKYAVCLK